MTTPDGGALARLELEREHTVQVLCRQFALDHLTTQELEARLEAAYRAGSSHELKALVAGLPEVPMTTSQDLAQRPAADVRVGPARERRVLAIFGSARKRGDWEMPERMRATAVFGDLHLDFREARIPLGVSTVFVNATFGQVRIIVPPGVLVECDGSAILGEFSERTMIGSDITDDMPTLRIVGAAIMGAVQVRMRLRE